MSASPARIAANRANALKSTGPRTVAGKEASRANSLKHGFTGAGVVIPGEDHEAVVGLVEQFTAEFAVEGSAAAHAFARRAALLIVRGERCARHEAAMMAQRVRNAEADFDEARRTEATHLLDYIAQDPINHHRRLMAMPEGVDALLDRMRLLRRALLKEDFLVWDGMCSSLFSYSRGERPESGPQSYAYKLGAMTMTGDDSGVPDAPTGELTVGAKIRWAEERMLGMIDAEIARLEAHRPTLDHARLAQDRAEAAERALLRDDDASRLARKYEAATERSLARAMVELRHIRREREAHRVEETVEAVRAEVAPAEHPAAERAELAGADVRAAAAALGSFVPRPSIAAPARDAAAITVAKVPGRPASRYEDRRKRPRPPR